MKTKRQAYLDALNNKKTQEMVWAPNFDYWLSQNKFAGTVPGKYKDMRRNRIVNAIGGTIWHRVTGHKTHLDKSVTVEEKKFNGDTRIIYKTPVGSCNKLLCKTETEHSSKFVKEHFIKDLESLRVMKYVVEATTYELDNEPVIEAKKETGNDGVVLNQSFCAPLIQYLKTDAGYIKGYYLWQDYKDEVDSYIQTIFEKFLEGISILSECSSDMIALGDNMDGMMISAELTDEYAIPFYQECKNILSKQGKLFQAHWCGRTQNLLHLLPKSGIDVIEAVVTTPMADITVNRVMEILDGKVVLQGGIPSVLVCEQGCTKEEFKRYIQDTVLPMKGIEGFILGMSDNVPPNADFSRVEMISKLIK